MRTSHLPLTTSDDETLHTTLWEPKRLDHPKAVVCLVHGFGEHSGRYQHVAAALTAADYIVWGIDNRGHGKSSGKRGFIPSYAQFLDDTDRFLQTAADRFPKLPLFLYGHSTGGGLILRYIYEYRPDLAGAIASSPWLRLARDPGFVGQLILWVCCFFRPQYTIDTGFTPGLLSRDPAVDAAHIADPLTHGLMTTGLLTGGISNGQLLLKHADAFPPTPLLLLHGTGDKLIAYKGSQLFAQRAAADHLTFVLFKDGAHELHNDLCKAELIQTLINWLDQQLL